MRLLKVIFSARKSQLCIYVAVIMATLLWPGLASSQQLSPSATNLESIFRRPPGSAKSWVFWYWMQGAVTKEGITADLEAMKENGLAGAYLMPIKGAGNPPLIEKPIIQLTPEWWEMVKFALGEAKRLGLQIAMHVSDGFALAGGPWITPDKSMQKIVWTQQQVKGGQQFNDTLPTPEKIENYYRDIAAFAYPSLVGSGVNSNSVVPVVTSSKPGVDVQMLADRANTKNFGSEDSCWIQYAFDKPFTVRSIIIRSRTNYQSNRLIVQWSNDGKSFQNITRLKPPRHGWQDWGAPYTHAVPATTARFFRFVYNKTGSEPGAEDLDAAKWKPSLKIAGIELSSEPKISQYEGKNGGVWRVSERTSANEVNAKDCVPLKNIIDISKFFNSNGKLNWKVPAGNWTILRIGHTSTGYRNDTGGGGKGLECDKFDPAAIKLQFDNWFGAVFNQVGNTLADSVLKVFHVDSWECGSQNWSGVFREEFRKRRGYDLLPYLPAMTGLPVESAAVSEKFLHDVRETISELVNDQFYGTLAKLAHEKGCIFTAESVAPTMVSDGMLHYKSVDVPMGEYWLRSPTHDKPNDMSDAISGAHVYGKNIIQAEAFTELRMAWDEHPGMLKSLQDRNYAMGINRLIYHVFMHNPWKDRKPGMTLDGIGLFFQRDQTWWKPGREWVRYAERCQALLQVGMPVIDIAVFTGEEIPRRSILPDRLLGSLPGLMGEDLVASEKRRLLNAGEPLRTMPAGVTHSANLADPELYIDPLHGYAYDSFNKDALLSQSTVINGNIVLKGGASYKLLVVPGKLKMSPVAEISQETAHTLEKLIRSGATVAFIEKFSTAKGLASGRASNNAVKSLSEQIWAAKGNGNGEKQNIAKFGEGRVVHGALKESSLDAIGIAPDFLAYDQTGMNIRTLAWTHRAAPGLDIYFISNQRDSACNIKLSLRVAGRIPEFWNPVTTEITTADSWKMKDGRIDFPMHLEANGSMFIIFRKASNEVSREGKNWPETKTLSTLTAPWTVNFLTKEAGPNQGVVFEKLTDWSENPDSTIKYYSGSATYHQTLDWPGSQPATGVWLNLGEVSNIAEISVNGVDCGVAWTPPFRVDISKALKPGKNELSITVTNTWANRLIHDQMLLPEMRKTNTNAPYRLDGKKLLPAGLFGPVTIEERR